MKKEWLSATLLTLVCLIIINGGYSAIVFGMAQLTPQKGFGERIVGKNGQEYYANIAQKFSDDRYFWPRPSAVDYNAAGSGGSNKGPANPEYLQTVSDRIDSFVAHNPGVDRASIPSELVTASGSGLDPDISMEAALVQVARVSKARGVPEARLRDLLATKTHRLVADMGPQTVNVLKLNIALDEL